MIDMKPKFIKQSHKVHYDIYNSDIYRYIINHDSYYFKNSLEELEFTHFPKYKLKYKGIESMIVIIKKENKSFSIKNIRIRYYEWTGSESCTNEFIYSNHEWIKKYDELSFIKPRLIKEDTMTYCILNNIKETIKGLMKDELN